jgi:hypothetical protein
MNLFILLIPVLIFNAIFTRYLPRGYQNFDENTPAWIAVPEKLLRLPVFLFPMVMKLQLSSPSQKFGLGLYVMGTLVYFIAWGAQIRLPLSSWSSSMAGFMAPAFTPALFLTGIGLIGDTLILPSVSYTPWIYMGLSGVFLVFHNMHAALVFSRNNQFS